MQTDLAVKALVKLSIKLNDRSHNLNADSDFARILSVIANDIDRALIDAGYRFTGKERDEA